MHTRPPTAGKFGTWQGVVVVVVVGWGGGDGAGAGLGGTAESASVVGGTAVEAAGPTGTAAGASAVGRPGRAGEGLGAGAAAGAGEMEALELGAESGDDGIPKELPPRGSPIRSMRTASITTMKAV